MLTFKEKQTCRWDLISLGEVLLRFDPGDRRIHSTREFTVWDGGAEYNVAANLSRVFRMQTSIITALADNAIGHLTEDLVRNAGVDIDEIIWRKHDGIGANTRNGLYFIERGFGLRAPASTFDRDNTAVSQLNEGDIDWTKMFGEKGALWLHTGGVFAGLSEMTPGVAVAGMQAAKANGTVVSYDLNYRHSLWSTRGGRDAANKLNRKLLPHADVVFGIFDFDSTLSGYSEDEFRTAAGKMLADFPNLKIIVSTLRETHSASRHDLAGVCLSNGEVFRSRDYKNIEVIDRVGSGDAFASAFIYSMLEGQDPQFAIDCASAHAALAMTTPGDGSMCTLNEVLDLVGGGDATIKR